MTADDVIQRLVSFGFVLLRQQGSHRLFAKGKNYITVPYHKGDLRRGTLRAIIKQSGLTVEEFLQ
jgi:predicted RNA binding protein YcfA (HicA-like mRNA interferase family)